MHITVVTPGSTFALPEVEAEVPEHFAEIADLIPTPAVGTPWQDVFNQQLEDVLQGWFRSGAFSRRNRRAYAKLNRPIRSAVAVEAAEPLSPQ